MQSLKENAGCRFKAAALIGIRKSDQGLAVSFFINDREVELGDLGVMIGGLRIVQDEFRQAFAELVQSQPKQNQSRPEKRKRIRTRKGPSLPGEV
jgi:hypothetical protein